MVPVLFSYTRSLFRSFVRIGLGVFFSSVSTHSSLPLRCCRFLFSLSTIYVDDTMKVSDATKTLHPSI